MNCSRVSVTELVNIFKGSLLSLAPWLCLAKIPIKRSDAYDNFDDIASVLFKAIVVDHINISSEPAPLAPFGMHLQSYKNNSFLRVCFPDSCQEKLAFVEFEFTDERTIQCKLAILNSDLSVKGFELKACEGMFLTLMLNVNGQTVEVEQIELVD